VKTQDDSWKINAFVDGELDLASQLEVEQRLHDDAALRRQVADMRELRDAVRESADRHTAPAALRARIAQRAAASPAAPAVKRPEPARPAVLGGALQRWLGWRPLAVSMSFAAVLAVALNLAWLQSQNDDRVSDEVVASHVRSTLGQHLVDVASSDHHTVKPFLSARLGFSPPVDELPIAGSTFLGGRVDYLEGRPVAALVYRQGEHVVNSFVWPSSSSGSKPAFSADRGFQTAHWSANGMTHWVISDVNRAEFQSIVKAVQALDAPH
jgi:anti-sigma factor RsiW